MSDNVLLARVERTDDGEWIVRAPRIGWWGHLPHRGALVGPGSFIGTLTRLNRRYRILLPEGVAGRVRSGLPPRRKVAVAYGEELFRLASADEASIAEFADEQATTGLRGASGLPEGCRALVAPTDGVFYRRPTPDAPPFVEAGQRIRLGQTVGLVEVMKTFNPIQYDGPGFPEEADVVEVRAEDATEIRAGDILAVLR